MAPFTSMLQSSGYGKSKTLLQLALSDNIFVLYLIIPPLKQGNGYPNPPKQQQLFSILSEDYIGMEQQVRAWLRLMLSLLLVGHQFDGPPSGLWHQMYQDTET
eukprot:3927621-Rhodomonas_salina.1